MAVYGQENSQLQLSVLPVSADLGPGNLNFPPLSQVHHEAASICIYTLKLLLSNSNTSNDDFIEGLDTFLLVPYALLK